RSPPPGPEVRGPPPEESLGRRRGGEPGPVPLHRCGPAGPGPVGGSTGGRAPRPRRPPPTLLGSAAQGTGSLLGRAPGRRRARWPAGAQAVGSRGAPPAIRAGLASVVRGDGARTAGETPRRRFRPGEGPGGRAGAGPSGAPQTPMVLRG